MYRKVDLGGGNGRAELRTLSAIRNENTYARELDLDKGRSSRRRDLPSWLEARSIHSSSQGFRLMFPNQLACKLSLVIFMSFLVY